MTDSNIVSIVDKVFEPYYKFLRGVDVTEFVLNEKQLTELKQELRKEIKKELEYLWRPRADFYNSGLKDMALRIIGNESEQSKENSEK